MEEWLINQGKEMLAPFYKDKDYQPVDITNFVGITYIIFKGVENGKTVMGLCDKRLGEVLAPVYTNIEFVREKYGFVIGVIADGEETDLAEIRRKGYNGLKKLEREQE